jgi:hypothetical protein
MKLATPIKTIPLLTALVTCVLLGPAFAQEIRGKVIHRTTGNAVIGASLLLLNETGNVQKMAITDATGAYSIIAPSPGNYSFRVDAPGYGRHQEPQFSVLAGRILELEIRLWDLTEVAPVVVTAESTVVAPGPLKGFYERMERGGGEYVTGEEIELSGVTRFTSILRMTLGVDVVSTGGTLNTIRIKGTEWAGTRGCAPALWVDNHHWGTVDLDGRGPDRDLYPADIAGIEVYRPTNVPIDFSSFDSTCGAIVVWTKRAPGLN